MRGRIQSGFHHFCIRGNNRYNVFYDPIDKLIFLIILDKYLRKFKFILMEFVVMDNHFHALVNGESITDFAKVFIRTFSYWHNVRHKMRGKVFETPFASWPKFTHEYQVKCGYYILQNPVAAKITDRAADYPWSSYYFHKNTVNDNVINVSRIIDEINMWGNFIYANTPIHEKKRFNFSYNNPITLEKIITVDTSYIDNFISAGDFADIVDNVKIKENEIPEINRDYHISTTNGDMERITTNFLNGKSIGSLRKHDREKLIIEIILNTNSTPMQISKYLHENYLYIWRLKNKLRR